eukprot:3812872-Rhodomonas_salina.2
MWSRTVEAEESAVARREQGLRRDRRYREEGEALGGGAGLGCGRSWKGRGICCGGRVTGQRQEADDIRRARESGTRFPGHHRKSDHWATGIDLSIYSDNKLTT